MTSRVRRWQEERNNRRKVLVMAAGLTILAAAIAADKCKSKKGAAKLRLRRP